MNDDGGGTATSTESGTETQQTQENWWDRFYRSTEKDLNASPTRKLIGAAKREAIHGVYAAFLPFIFACLVLVLSYFSLLSLSPLDGAVKAFVASYPFSWVNSYTNWLPG